MEIPVFNTYIHPLASQKVGATLQSTFISEGKAVKEFENRLADALGLLNPLALNSGTSALHLALVVAGVEEHDEVIIPAQTFVATGMVVLQQKAVPVFADIDYETGNINPASIEERITSKTKAIIPVHWGGYPCDMDEIGRIAKKNGLVVIEDAAHALGATYKGRPIGSISDYTCFSFQAIKHLTTGDGGAVSFLKHENYRQGLARRWFCIDRQSAALSILGERQYDIKALGFKYHMNDYSAALGIANLEGFAARLSARRKAAERYTSQLSSVSGISLFKYDGHSESAYWLYGFHVDKREDFIRAMKERGISASVIHQRIDRNAIFGGLKDLPVQERFDETQIHIPIHDDLNEEKVDYIIAAIKKGW